MLLEWRLGTKNDGYDQKIEMNNFPEKIQLAKFEYQTESLNT